MLGLTSLGSPMTTSINGLECRLGLGRVALPTDAVDLLGEYVVGARLPWNDRVGYAIGVWDGAPILSVSITPHDPEPSRTARGALLVTPGTSIRWAFEIDEPLGLVAVVDLARPSPAMPWRRTATLADGRSLQFIDVSSMLRELSSEPPRLRP